MNAHHEDGRSFREPDELAGLAEELRRVASQLLAVCDREISGRQASPALHPPTAEEAGLLMVKQMAAVAMAQAHLAVHFDGEPVTQNPGTALARMVTEGLIYLNYMLTDEPDWRAREFWVGDILFRDHYECRCAGRVWSRYHGTEPQRVQSGSVTAHVRLCVSDDERRALDAFEVEYIHRGRGALGLAEGSNCADGARAEWNSLALSGDALKNWRAENRRWNTMRSRPFGLLPREAQDRGKLVATVRRLVESDQTVRRDNTNIGHFVSMTEEWILRLGLGLFSDLCHFSAARVYINSRELTCTALVLAEMGLFWTTRIAAEHFVWAREAKNAMERPPV